MREEATAAASFQASRSSIYYASLVIQPVDVTPELERSMLVIEIREPERAPRSMAFTRHGLGLGRKVPSLSIGRSAADVNLESARVKGMHFELVEREGLLELHALEPVVVDGHALARGPKIIGVGAAIEIADCTVVLKAFVPIVPPDFEVAEREFLDLTRADRSDIGARLVYADALEERGWLIRAEYLRVQVRIVMGEQLEGDVDARDRFFRKLACASRWLATMSSPVLAVRCGMNAGRECPVRWGAVGPPSLCWKCQRGVNAPMSPST